jgi:hypothetical protein
MVSPQRPNAYLQYILTVSDGIAIPVSDYFFSHLHPKAQLNFICTAGDLELNNMPKLSIILSLNLDRFLGSKPWIGSRWVNKRYAFGKQELS